MDVRLLGKRERGVRKLPVTFYWLDLRDMITLRKPGKYNRTVGPKRATFDHH